MKRQEEVLMHRKEDAFDTIPTQHKSPKQQNFKL